ncbi:hypothetical protein TWF225_000206 [Orbilia oligospora]|uniref:Uncharacterized protein n=1 Tax=Orbilia oligospora TaxID=2813651 RepID=A0A7C8PXV1_ORBOL|nr:hypothetical protein TWF751_004239 [Orbilia oligospora]KAF3195831.1 hypothetical protein TWF225_000206 [Orbilia oligospora]KAF3266411.1 hypothetical protein TWF128_010819 [Orbilia oligospora]KAF3272253.1 hypothetical protein TWF217_004048 [Orbilia oligospora]KAF3297577.1 hypothetical protein TWF132_005997 [Orbilia oligospora]
MPKSTLPMLAELLALTAASYVVSQALKSYMNEKPFLDVFDVPVFIDVLLYNVFKVPAHMAWNVFLDDMFDPKKPSAKKNEKDNIAQVPKPPTKIAWKSVLVKLFFNQTLWSGLVNASVIAFMSFRRRTRAGTMSYEDVYGDLQRGFWPLYKDALKVWPLINMVALVAFDAMPRMRFLTIANFFWSVYLILVVT